jgi:PAS domain S-box-containing protein
VLHYESRIIWNDGSIHWIEVKGKVFYDDNNVPEHLIGTLRDITDEKNRQQELFESEQKFRLLADSMPQFIWTTTAEGIINYFNQSFYNYSGLTQEEIEKEGWLQIVHPDEQLENNIKWMNSINTGNDFLCEHRFRRNDGAFRWQLTRAVPQRDATGNIQMWVGTSTDIQEQKMFTHKLEKQVFERTKQLEEKNMELEKMNLELQSFAYVSSHDLQEPLRKIQTFSTRILDKEQANLSETGKDYFKRMQAAAKRMQQLIQDLLDYSRTSTIDRVFEKSNMNDIIEDVKKEFKESIADKNATVTIEGICEVNIIPFQFRQLMQNLLGNALKFSRPNVAPVIVIKSVIVPGSQVNVPLAYPKNNYCHLAFSDNGIGFDPQYKSKIFEVFQRLHGRNEYEGTGIGLAIVKKIVENHNGFIDVVGELGKGTTFNIYIPIL